MLMKKVILIAVLVVAALGLVSPVLAEWTPSSGTVYVPPTSGTLVLDEMYGSNNDGQGTWGTPTNGTVTINADDIVITLAGDGTNYAYINLPLPFRPVDTDYVIDVGLKEWTTTVGGTRYNSLWWMQSNYGPYAPAGSSSNRINQQWIAKASTITGRYGNTIPFAQSTGYVMRFTHTVSDPNHRLITNLGNDGVCIEKYAVGGESLNYLRLYCEKLGQSANKIAWIKIYTGVSTTAAPLAPKPVWTPSGTTYVPPTSGTMVLNELYGSNNDGQGTWTGATGAVTVTQNADDMVISLGTGVSSSINLPLPFRPVDTNYVIDVGLKQWTTSIGGTRYNSLWGIQSKYGAYNGGSYRVMDQWVAKYDTITAAHDSAEIMAFAQSTGYVMRFTGKVGDVNSKLVTSLGLDGDCVELHTTGGVDNNYLQLYSGYNGQSDNTIAWVRVYTGVSTTASPIELKPVWTPSGTAYVPPASGTMVLNEMYGSSGCGQGTWTGATGAVTVTQNADDMVITLAGDGTNNAYIHLPLPFRPVDNDYVIDVGLKQWATSIGGTRYNSLWCIQSKYGAYDGGLYRVNDQWVAKYDTITAGRNSAEVMAFAQSTGYVMRFTAKSGETTAALITNLGLDGDCIETNTTGGIDDNYLQLYTANNGQSDNTIAWIRVYTGVSTNEPPLQESLLSDIDGPANEPDGQVDFYDLSLMVENWLQPDITEYLPGDFNKDYKVNFQDFRIIGAEWMEGTE